MTDTISVVRILAGVLALNAAFWCAACGSSGNVVCGADDEFGEHLDADNASPLSAPATATGIVCGFEQDWYRYETDPGCRLDVLLTFEDADGDLGLAVYRLDEGKTALLAQSFGSGDEESVRLEVSDEVFIQIRGEGSGVGGIEVEYMLVIDDECFAPPATSTGATATSM